MTEKKKPSKEFPGKKPEGNLPSAGGQPDPKGKPDPAVGPDPKGGKPAEKARTERV